MLFYSFLFASARQQLLGRNGSSSLLGIFDVKLCIKIMNNYFKMTSDFLPEGCQLSTHMQHFVFKGFEVAALDPCVQPSPSP